MMTIPYCLSLCCLAALNVAKGGETAEQVMRTGSFELPCKPQAAFPLFSPEGEKKWVPGWDPHPIFPVTIAFARDTVFREGKGDEEAIWTIIDADCQTRRAEYVRLAPASHTAHIIVQVDALGQDHSKVTVSYTVTAFGEHANTLLESFSEGTFAKKMQNWQRWITTHLKQKH